MRRLTNITTLNYLYQAYLGLKDMRPQVYETNVTPEVKNGLKGTYTLKAAYTEGLIYIGEVMVREERGAFAAPHLYGGLIYLRPHVLKTSFN
jgi:hypothetical protein